MNKFSANPKSFAEYCKTHAQSLKAAASSEINPTRLYRLTLSVLSRTPALADCTIVSLFRGMQQAAEVGLEPGTALGLSYLVPFRNTELKVVEAQFIIGYRGMLELVRRGNRVGSVQAFCVYESDEFDAALGDQPYIHHRPKWDGERADDRIRYVYAVARLKDGTLMLDIMTRGEVDRVRARSKAANAGPWVTDYAEMAKKTVLRRLCKVLPMSIEQSRAMEIDAANEFGDVNPVTGEISGEDPFNGALPIDIPAAELITAQAQGA